MSSFSGHSVEMY